MAQNAQEELLEYYQQEMAYLRRSGARFAQQYPHVAEALNLTATDTSDPHVERLLESFAFLTAKLQKDVDDRFSRFSNTLLSVLYPQFVQPFPSSSIAHFKLSPHLGKLATGTVVPKGTQLYTEAQNGEKCRFQTIYPVEMWPVEIIEAGIISQDQLNLPEAPFNTQWFYHLRIQRYDGAMSDLNFSSLRFSILGGKYLTNFIYSTIFGFSPNAASPILFQGDAMDMAVVLPSDSISPVGFNEGENLIPYPPQSHEAYRLLCEYFMFPEKFMFFDLKNLAPQSCNQYFDIYIGINPSVKLDKIHVSSDNFKLGCTPIVNLFPKISEPLDLTNQSIAYKLIPDQRRQGSTEIHSIQKVTAAVPGKKDTLSYSPYFSYNHDMEENDQSRFWYAQRKPTDVPNAIGTDMWLSFVDFKFNPNAPSNQSIYAHTLCTNRDLATFVPAGAALQVDGSIPSAVITCVMRPTPQVNPLLSGDNLWQLISQLSLNHLSLSCANNSIVTLKEMLRLYMWSSRYDAQPEINALEGISYQTSVRRTGTDGWRGFVQGLSINLTTSSNIFEGSGLFLLCSVLNQFFSLYVGINSYTSYAVCRRREKR
ncbi:Type VI secretion system baseplate subunit TssF [Candidatus Bealeia paramacronuclearis]|uniref:Type VI secretion system baseplate subunit TssF n=1 Tax=Candidatus Bealeia paramacronuclearis TaxID=1921001 RepID=A0ABZ2C1P3_9PROT|nr:Type VI secretion system baseplate subunit TssF [Candidatus Bealeia paramacronuclearis]